MNQEILNPMPDGTARTIKSNYYKQSFANFIRGGVWCNSSRSPARLSARYGNPGRTAWCTTKKESPHAYAWETIAA